MNDWITKHQRTHRRIFLEANNFDITYRELLASISIIAVMLLIGFVISGRIQNWHMDKTAEYNKAVQVESKDLFQYGMDTSVGNAFVYGGLEAVDTVTYPEIGGEYMYIEKVKQRYTMHTRIVRSGKTSYVQTYWTWDTVGREDIQCKELSFLGIFFGSNKIKIPSADYIDTIMESSHVRYKYYGTATKFTGTIYTDLRNHTISDESEFYNDTEIKDVLNGLQKDWWNFWFWIGWIVLIAICVGGFYYAENSWLED